MNDEVIVLLRRPNGTVLEPCGSSRDERAQWQMTGTPSNSTDSVQKPKDDSVAAFDAALAEHRDEIFQYLRKRVVDREAAADLLQETFARAMKYRHANDIQDYRLMLFRIANNLIFEYHRTRKRHHAGYHLPLSEMEQLQAHEPPVEATIDARKAIDTLLKKTIIELPPKCRLAFMLSRFDELSYPQIADRMGISVKMVEKHITKALLACRVAIGDRDF